jgi:hypothetical protein
MIYGLVRASELQLNLQNQLFIYFSARVKS